MVVIHQPDFLPHLAFFHRLIFAETLIILDDASFVSGTSRSWTHRDKIKTRNGEKWLSLSVEKAPLNTPIKDIRLSADPKWRVKNLNLISENYRKAAFFKQVFPLVEDLYEKPTKSLADFNVKSIKLILSFFDLKVNLVFASEFKQSNLKRNERLVELILAQGETSYLSGTGAKAYFEPEPFEAAGINVCWQEFRHPIYPQLFDGFIPFLSSIDLLFNCGTNASRKILMDSK